MLPDASDGSRALERDDAVGRRDFLRRTVLLVLGSSAFAAGLVGCNSGDDGEEEEGTLAAVLAAARTGLQGIFDALTNAQTVDAATISGYVTQINQHLANVQAEAAGAAQADLRALVPSSLAPVLAQLDGWDEDLDYSQAPPQFTVAGLTAAAERAEALLAGLSAADRRVTWVFAYALAALEPDLENSVLESFIGLARTGDTTNVGGRLYDSVFGAAAVGAAATGLSEPTTTAQLVPEMTLLLLLAKQSAACTDLTMLIAVLAAVLTMIMLALSPGVSPWG